MTSEVATLTPRVREFLAAPLRAYIPARSAEPGASTFMEITDPGRNEVVAQVEASTSKDVDVAVRSAREALPSWRRLSASKRERLMNRLADLIEENAETFAQLESIDTGKAVRAARNEVAQAVNVFRYFAGWPTKVEGGVHPVGGDRLAYTLRQPVGVCGLITAWNYPLLLASFKLAPALACGNTTVLKPADLTPLTSLLLGSLTKEAGFPDGVVSVLPGVGIDVGHQLVTHPGINKVSFTGSTVVGKAIMNDSAANLVRLTLELGGKGPNIVFRDADLESAAAGAALAVFWNAGQVCVAGSRLLVHESIHDEFVAAVIKHAQSLKTGYGLDETSDVGALISQEHLSRVDGYVTNGVTSGAQIAVGGSAIEHESGGFYYRPTVLVGVESGSRVAQEEIFGPVLSVIPFTEEAEAISKANDSQYGLAGCVWTTRLETAHRVAAALDVGTVWVNSFGQLDPAVSFGGRKQSGFGVELGKQAVDAFTETKGVYVNLGRGA
jgi:acyl-CoA reductase-like NAD-dependent aldehyde dehydrogenase